MRRGILLTTAFIWIGEPQTAAQGVDIEMRRAEMQGHYSQLIAIHDAVARGDLEAVRQPATELAYLSVPAGSPAGAGGFGVAIRDGARRAARETTIVGAARATVSIIRACAGCHRANHAAISPQAVVRRLTAPASTTDHIRAADDMLLGLLLPSETRWESGVDGLRAAVFPTPNGAPPPGIDATLRYLTDRLRRSTIVAERTSNYVQLLTTCAQCHQGGRP